MVENVRARLHFWAKGENAMEGGTGYQLREPPAPYEPFLRAKNEDVGLENTCLWDVKVE